MTTVALSSLPPSSDVTSSAIIPHSEDPDPLEIAPDLYGKVAVVVGDGGVCAAIGR